MKHILFAMFITLIGLLFIAPAAEAQQFTTQNPNGLPSAFQYPVWSAKTYAASQNDTSGVYNLGGVSQLEAYIVYNDSVNVITEFQYRASSSAAWAWVSGDTLNHTGGGAVTGSTIREKVLRSPTVSSFNFGGQLRAIQHFQATVIGVTTPTYSVTWRWKP
ncbi:MAG: hypothetical protein AB1428_13075 [Bacteroidota bacterium]